MTSAFSLPPVFSGLAPAGKARIIPHMPPVPSTAWGLPPPGESALLHRLQALSQPPRDRDNVSPLMQHLVDAARSSTSTVDKDLLLTYGNHVDPKMLIGGPASSTNNPDDRPGQIGGPDAVDDLGAQAESADGPRPDHASAPAVGANRARGSVVSGAGGLNGR